MSEIDQIQMLAAVALGVGLVVLLGYFALFVFSLIRLSDFGSSRLLVVAALAIPILVHLAQLLSSVILPKLVSSSQFGLLSVGMSVLWNLLTFVSYVLLVLAVINAGSRRPESA